MVNLCSFTVNTARRFNTSIVSTYPASRVRRPGAKLNLKKELLTKKEPSDIIETKPSPAVCSIMECQDHKDILKELDLYTVTDFMVGYILTQNITVYKTALECNLVVKMRSMMNIQRGRLPESLDPEIKIGRFSVAEDLIIIHNWNKMLRDLEISEEEAKKEWFLSDTKKSDVGKKQNIVGYFLSQGLDKVRLATDIFYRARVLVCLNRGVFTAEEDQLILDFVEKEGHKWTRLGKEMNRSSVTLISRYYSLLNGDDLNYGQFTEEEDEKILTLVFNINKSVLRDGNIGKEDWENIAKELMRSRDSVYKHWHYLLLPLLKRYHAGTLMVDVREVLVNHMVEHGMDYAQDVDWKELVKLDKFAGTTTGYLQRKLDDARKATSTKYPNLLPEELTSEEMQRYLNSSERYGTPETKEERQQQLIEYYVTNILRPSQGKK